MNLDQIKTFIAVYRVRSFVEVANERGLAPSSISRSISSLENILKTRLFQRTTRSLTPTLEGEAYYKNVVPLIEEMDLAHQSLVDSTMGPSGRLRITASVSYGQVAIAPKLKQFRSEYPDIDLELHMSDSRIDLINDQVDLAIRHGVLHDSSLVARKLADVEYCLVASLAYLEKHRVPAKPEDLEGHELVTFSYNDFRSCWNFENGELTHKLTIKPVLTANNAVTIRQCVRDGLGIALLADWTVEEDLKSERLIKVLPDWKVRGASEETAIWIVFPSNRFIPIKTRVFVDFLINSK